MRNECNRVDNMHPGMLAETSPRHSETAKQWLRPLSTQYLVFCMPDTYIFNESLIYKPYQHGLVWPSHGLPWSLSCTRLWCVQVGLHQLAMLTNT